MSHWQFELRRLACNEEGQDLVEYAFLIVFLSLLITGTLQATNSSIGGVYSFIIAALPI